MAERHALVSSEDRHFGQGMVRPFYICDCRFSTIYEDRMEDHLTLANREQELDVLHDQIAVLKRRIDDLNAIIDAATLSFDNLSKQADNKVELLRGMKKDANE